MTPSGSNLQLLRGHTDDPMILFTNSTVNLPPLLFPQPKAFLHTIQSPACGSFPAILPSEGGNINQASFLAGFNSTSGRHYLHKYRFLHFCQMPCSREFSRSFIYFEATNCIGSLVGSQQYVTCQVY
jgi:hypothetical protein